MKRIVVIGLGIFGINLVKQLHENGLEVLALTREKKPSRKLRISPPKLSSPMEPTGM